MIFEEIRLYNFGIYQGHHVLSLDSADHTKPIILIGALNGAGKTTFLDALQLALYGKFAKCSNRGRLSYSAYLEKNINSFSDDRSASITLRFRHGDNRNKPQIYEIHRFWTQREKKECRESLQVSLNGLHDQLLSENWDDFVNEFIPQSLSELFFFDGEKIENLADPKRASELLKTGIEALLGLNLLSTLSNDLSELKKKKQEKLLSRQDSIELEEIKKELSLLKEKKEIITRKIKIIDQNEECEQENYSLIKIKLQASGADKLAFKEALDAEKKEASQRKFEVKHDLIKILSGSLPLYLVESLLDKTEKQSIFERNVSTFNNAKELLENQKNKYLSIIAKTVGEKELAYITNEINSAIASEYTYDEDNCYLNINPFNFKGLVENIFEQKKLFSDFLVSKREIEEELLLIERKIHAIPSVDSVKDLIAEFAKCEQKLEQIRKEKLLLVGDLNSILNEIKNYENSYNAVLIKTNATLFEHQRQNQIVTHIDTLKNIVKAFNNQLVKENISRLEKKIKAKFDQLKRKDSLINRIEINPVTYSMTLYASNLLEISTERLSAGERQLLAIAILWGLADSSGKELPTIIDTPMGRLDGEHRTRLIEKYFPNAASQVILLSTDEEIYGQYYEKLQPFIAQEYSINYDDSKKSSYFVDSYLENAK